MEELQQTAGDVRMANLAGKYLTFSLSAERYAIPILQVVEIIGVLNITPVPRAPKHIKGVINLRGKIIPVIDLRLKFDMEEKGYDEETCIIIVNVKYDDTPLQLGMVVDTVLEVIDFVEGDLSAAPDYGCQLDTRAVMGMGKQSDGNVVIVCDIDRFFTAEEVTGIVADAE